MTACRCCVAVQTGGVQTLLDVVDQIHVLDFGCRPQGSLSRLV